MFAILPARSHSATSTAPSGRSWFNMRMRDHIRWKWRSRSSGCSPISIGLMILMMRLASPLAGRLDEPRKLCPSKPWSVLMVTSPRSLFPAKRPLWRPYWVAGMSSQANSVTLTSMIFIVDLPCVIPALVAGIHLAACSGD